MIRLELRLRIRLRFRLRLRLEGGGVGSAMTTLARRPCLRWPATQCILANNIVPFLDLWLRHRLRLRLGFLQAA